MTTPSDPVAPPSAKEVFEKLFEIARSHRERMKALLVPPEQSWDIPVALYNQNVERAYEYGIESAGRLREAETAGQAEPTGYKMKPVAAPTPEAEGDENFVPQLVRDMMHTCDSEYSKSVILHAWASTPITSAEKIAAPDAEIGNGYLYVPKAQYEAMKSRLEQQLREAQAEIARLQTLLREK